VPAVLEDQNGHRLRRAISQRVRFVRRHRRGNAEQRMIPVSYRTWPLLLAAGVFALDRVTKIAIERSVSVWDSYPIIPNVLNIV
jgi:hypothetical protein